MRNHFRGGELSNYCCAGLLQPIITPHVSCSTFGIIEIPKPKHHDIMQVALNERCYAAFACFPKICENKNLLLNLKNIPQLLHKRGFFGTNLLDTVE
jgi:hypothetical protein